MRKSKLSLLMMLLAFAFLFNACSDDNPTEPGNGDNDDAASYYKIEVGNWWIYQNSDLDTLDQVIEGTDFIDTTRVIASMQYQGKNAFLMTSTYNDEELGVTTVTFYVAVEGQRLYQYMSNLGNDQLLVPFGGWILLADFNGTEWTVLDTTIKDQDVDFGGGQTGKLNAKFTIKGKKLDKENITVKGETVEAQEFLQTVEIMDGSITVGGVDIPLNQTINVTFWFGKNVGIAKTYQPATKMTIPMFGNMQIDGSKSDILDYSVK